VTADNFKKSLRFMVSSSFFGVSR